MKKLTILLLVVLLSSCEVQKRRYNKGFYFDWFSGGKAKAQKEKAEVPKGTDAEAEVTFLEGIENALPIPSAMPEETVITGESGNRVMIPAEEETHDQAVVRESPVKQEIKTESSEERHAIKDRSDQHAESSMTREKKNEKKDSTSLFIYWFSAALLLFTGALKFGRKQVMGITRWAKRNPKSTIGLIAGFQLGAVAIAHQVGFSLSQMGFSISGYVSIIAAAAMMIGYNMAPFFQRKGSIFSAANLNKHRFAYLLTGLSSVMMAGHFGNHVNDNFSNTSYSQVVENIDHFLFGGAADEQSPEPVDRHRAMVTSVISAGAILLMILCSILACAGVCAIVIGAIMFVESAVYGFLWITGGILGLWLAVKGFQHAIASAQEG